MDMEQEVDPLLRTVESERVDIPRPGAGSHDLRYWDHPSRMDVRNAVCTLVDW
jgi:hypothetical protein